MWKKVYKYATGEEVPLNAVYLCTIKNGKLIDSREGYPPDYQYVWHYFLVEVEDSRN